MPGKMGRWADDSGRRKRLEETLPGLRFIKNLQLGEKHANWKVAPLVILSKDKHKELGQKNMARLGYQQLHSILDLCH